MKLQSLLEHLKDANPEAEVLFRSSSYDDDAIGHVYEISTYEKGDLIAESGEDFSLLIEDGKAIAPIIIIS